MGVFQRRVITCPVCHEALPRWGDKLEHWIGHTYQIAAGQGAGGYTWVCSCGPAAMYWDERYQAGAGLAIHMLDLHAIAI